MKKSTSDLASQAEEETGKQSTAGDMKAMMFTTNTVNPVDRFESWRTAFGSLHDVEVARELRSGFEAKAIHWQLDTILFGVYNTPARKVMRTAKRVASDDIDHWVLRIPLKGKFRSRSNDGSMVIEAGQLGLGTFARPYTDDHTGGEWITAIFPRDMLPALDDFTANAEMLNNVSGRILTEYLITLARQLPQATCTEMNAIALATRMIITTLLMPENRNRNSSGHIEHFLTRERVNRVIRDNIASARLDPARVCELAGLSRSTLYRMFETRGGVAEYILRKRLTLVYRDLTDPLLWNFRICDLAERRGLHNIASFNRAFKRHFDCTPGDVRKKALFGAETATEKIKSENLLKFTDLL